MASAKELDLTVLAAAAWQFLDVSDSDSDSDGEDVRTHSDNLAVFCGAAFEMRENRPKIEDFVVEVVPIVSEQTFRRMFRLSRSTFAVLKQHLETLPEMQFSGMAGIEPIPVSTQLYVTLWYFGSLDTIQKLSNLFGISESSVIECRNRVVNAIITHMRKKFITWPQDMQEEIQQFQRRHGFPGIVGALDGTFIEINKPKNHPQSYFSRKKKYHIQMQAVCKNDMTFTDVFIGYPGSVHDAKVLKNSELWDNGDQLCAGNHILGDGAYPLKKWLLTPYRDNGHLTREQRRYNFYHSSCRMVIERSFGLMKNRFRRLLKLHTRSVVTSVKLIMCCAVLHNICILSGEDVEEYLQRDEDCQGPHQLVPDDQNDNTGLEKRNRIAQNLI